MSELWRPLRGFFKGEAFTSKRLMRVRLKVPLERRHTSTRKESDDTKSLTFQGRSGDPLIIPEDGQMASNKGFWSTGRNHSRHSLPISMRYHLLYLSYMVLQNRLLYKLMIKKWTNDPRYRFDNNIFCLNLNWSNISFHIIIFHVMGGDRGFGGYLFTLFEKQYVWTNLKSLIRPSSKQ